VVRPVIGIPSHNARSCRYSTRRYHHFAELASGAARSGLPKPFDSTECPPEEDIIDCSFDKEAQYWSIKTLPEPTTLPETTMATGESAGSRTILSADTMTIAERVRTARIAANKTQQQLAGDTYSKSYISAVERGKMIPSVQALGILAERLGLPMSYFLEESDVDENGYTWQLYLLTQTADEDLDWIKLPLVRGVDHTSAKPLRRHPSQRGDFKTKTIPHGRGIFSRK
jgi:transcriptional regulator with XRE-family HTH domain